MRPSLTVFTACTTYWVANVAPIPATSQAKIFGQPTLPTSNIGAGSRATNSPMPPTLLKAKPKARMIPAYIIIACKTLV
ncbi:hypothetical protein D3C72_2477430 [compost metagenome]